MEIWKVTTQIDALEGNEFFMIFGFHESTKELKHTYGPFNTWRESNDFCNMHNIQLPT